MPACRAAETIVAIASMAQVSVDWLLPGLSEDESTGELVASDLEIESNAGLPMDERLQRWHAAVGYKIRYVPTTLPDLLKTKEGRLRVPGVQRPGARGADRGGGAAPGLQPPPETDIEACSLPTTR